MELTDWVLGFSSFETSRVYFETILQYLYLLRYHRWIGIWKASFIFPCLVCVFCFHYLLCILHHLVLDLPDCYLCNTFIFDALKRILLLSMWNTYSCYLPLISPSVLRFYVSCFISCFVFTLHRNFIPIVCNLLASLLAHVYRSVLKTASDMLCIKKVMTISEMYQLQMVSLAAEVILWLFFFNFTIWTLKYSSMLSEASLISVMTPTVGCIIELTGGPT